MKQYCRVIDSGPFFRRVVQYFWASVESMSQEDRARLLQFVTGSPTLPPGGFKELKPSLQISAESRNEGS
jgi:hypothetical protein